LALSGLLTITTQQPSRVVSASLSIATAAAVACRDRCLDDCDRHSIIECCRGGSGSSSSSSGSSGRRRCLDQQPQPHHRYWRRKLQRCVLRGCARLEPLAASDTGRHAESAAAQRLELGLGLGVWIIQRPGASIIHVEHTSWSIIPVIAASESLSMARRSPAILVGSRCTRAASATATSRGRGLRADMVSNRRWYSIAAARMQVRHRSVDRCVVIDVGARSRVRQGAAVARVSGHRALLPSAPVSHSLGRWNRGTLEEHARSLARSRIDWIELRTVPA